MNKLEQIEYLVAHLSILQEQSKHLHSHLISLCKHWSADETFPPQEGESLMCDLSRLLTEQQEMQKMLEELEPSWRIITYTETKRQLELKQEQLSQQRHYEDALSLFSSLQTQNSEQTLALDSYLDNLLPWEGNPTPEQIEHLLTTAQMVQEILTTQESRARYTLSLKLKERLGEVIATGLYFNDISVAVVEPSVQPEEKLDSPHKQLAPETKEEKVDEKVEKQPEEEKITANNQHYTISSEECLWEKLEISDPDPFLVSVDADTLHKEEVTISKPFGAKLFKKELNDYDRKEKCCLLRMAKEYNGITPALAAVKSDQPEENFQNTCERLVRNGYFTCYQLESYGSFYTLTDRGEKIFQTQDAAKLLGLSQQKKVTAGEYVPLEHAGHLALVHLMRLAIPVHFAKAASIKGTQESMHQFDCGFVTSFSPVGTKRCTVGYLGAAISCAKDVEQLQEVLLEVISEVDLLIVVGVTFTHGKTIATWMKNHLSQQLEGKAIWYLGWQEQTYYDLDTDEVVELMTFCSPEPELQVPPEPTPQKSDLPVHEQEQNKSLKSNPVLEPKSLSVVLSPEEKAHFDSELYTMLAEKQFHCASAFLHVLAQEYPNYYQHESRKLSYALNDPLEHCNYSAGNIADVFSMEDESCLPIPTAKLGSPAEIPYRVADDYMICAALRVFFLNHHGYHYDLESLWDTISKHVSFKEGSLRELFYQLKEFKTTHHRGVDFYADYRQKDREIFERKISQICTEAKTQYENYVLGRIREDASLERLLRTRKLIFSSDSDLAECLDIVQRDDRSLCDYVRDFLLTHYIRNDEEIEPANIDQTKIDFVIDTAWKEAGNQVRVKKHSSHLMSSRRNNLAMTIQRSIEILCRYVLLLADGDPLDGDQGLLAYRRIRKPLLQNITSVRECLENQVVGEDLEQAAGQAILSATLEELQYRLEGSYEDNSQYFYLPFLTSDQILLDENYLPELSNLSDLPQLSPINRIRQHIQAPKKTLEERFWSIYQSEQGWGDDYGSANLILHYLHTHPTLVQNAALLSLCCDDLGFDNPEEFLDNQRRTFIEDMELKQSYGLFDHVDSNQKEYMVDFIEMWCERTKKTKNFNFFHLIICALYSKIESDAKVREQDLLESLQAFLCAHPDQMHDSKEVQEIYERIRVQNYTAAEDLLNRLNTGDVEEEKEKPGLENTDYLLEFLKEYDINVKQAGVARLALKPVHQHNKDTKGGNRLIEYWPKGMGTSPDQIRKLLEWLDFSVEKVQTAPAIQGKEHFLVSLNRNSSCKHPVSAFGSLAVTEGFRVLCIFGFMDARRLIDTFHEIGTTKNTLILLDYSLSLADRRTLARLSKEQFTEKTFAVLDRVALLYLVNHYSKGAINRMLMAVVMPFAAAKLYEPSSARELSPELFIGRKRELDQIKSPSGVNLVYGGRQLGKTALLRKAKQEIDHNDNGDRAVWIDIKYKNYQQVARSISQTLYDEGILKTEHITEDWDELARDIKNRLRDEKTPIPYLLLLLDEADAFIESCEAVKFQPLDALKNIQSIGPNRFKFVVAGLHNVVRFKRDIALSGNSGLTHLDSLMVTPFKYREARELLEIPLSYLGFRFPDNQDTARLISTIFTSTNYFPGLLQLYCTKLLETVHRNYAGYNEVDTPPYGMNETLIKKVLSDESLRQQIQDKFYITITVDQSDEKQDDYYYLISLLTAYCIYNAPYQKGVSPEEIQEAAAAYEIQKLATLQRDSLQVLMEEMQELNILNHLGNGRYRFARFNFLRMMGNISEIEDKILDYAEKAMG